jgi:hypothetical protein
MLEMIRVCARLAFVAGVGMSATAQAALYDRGGGLIYDDVLNVTWLQDANLAQTSGYDADGLMTWQNAVAWAANLSYFDSVRNVTYSDWRLPTTSDLGSPACNFAYSGTNCGYNVANAGEMAYLFYIELGNIAYYSTTGYGMQPGWGLANTGPFANLQAYGYWSGTEYVPDTDQAWVFTFDAGGQYLNNKSEHLFALAVRDGDVAAIPEPETYAMLLAGLGLVGWAAKRRKPIFAESIPSTRRL